MYINNNIHNNMYKIHRTFSGIILLHSWFIILTLVFSAIHTKKKKKKDMGHYAHFFSYTLKLCHQSTHYIQFWCFPFAFPIKFQSHCTLLFISCFHAFNNKFSCVYIILCSILHLNYCYYCYYICFSRGFLLTFTWSGVGEISVPRLLR